MCALKFLQRCKSHPSVRAYWSPQNGEDRGNEYGAYFGAAEIVRSCLLLCQHEQVLRPPLRLQGRYHYTAVRTIPQAPFAFAATAVA